MSNEDELDPYIASFDSVIEFFSTLISFSNPNDVSRFIGTVMLPCINLFVPLLHISESLDRKVVNLIADIGSFCRPVLCQILGTGNSAASFRQLVVDIRDSGEEPETKSSCELALRVIQACTPPSQSGGF